MSTHFFGTTMAAAITSSSTTVRAGYRATTNLVTIEPDLVAGNIKAGVTMFGIPGTVSSGPWLVKDSGQTMIYVAGDDGSYMPANRQPSYTNNGNGTITDNRTGLMWGNPYDFWSYPDIGQLWYDALMSCENSTLAGYTDWRMPNINELITILEFPLTSPCVRTSLFPFPDPAYGPPTLCWSSTIFGAFPDNNKVWVVDFTNGTIMYQGTYLYGAGWACRNVS